MSTPDGARERRVYVRCGPEREAGLAAAVARAGWSLGGVAEAEAIVWAADDPPTLANILHDRIHFVQLSSAGIEEWFAAGAIDNRRVWAAAKGVYGRPISEYCVSALLAVSKRFPQALSAPGWTPLDPDVLRSATVLVVGAGGIGRALIELLAPLEPTVIAVTRAGREVLGANSSVGPAELDAVLPSADFVVVAAPETPQTVGLLSPARLNLLKKGAWLVNVSRGTLVDTPGLVAALRSGQLGGAFLDVTDPEPLPDGHPLWEFDNVIITCHTASTPRLGRQAFEERVEQNLRRVAAGEAPLGDVDVDAQY